MGAHEPILVDKGIAIHLVPRLFIRAVVASEGPLPYIVTTAYAHPDRHPCIGFGVVLGKSTEKVGKRQNLRD
jgi:hypothetical protein